MDPQNTVQDSNLTGGEENKSVGPAIGIVIIILIVILGGLYFWSQRMNSQKSQASDAAAAQAAAEDSQSLSQMMNQGSSDEAAAIEADLNATNIDSLGSEVNDMNAAANGSTQAQ